MQMNSSTNQSGTTSPAPPSPWNMDNNSNYWYANECFSKYWRHYNDARQWYINHLHYLNSMNNSSYYPPQMSSAHLQPPWNQTPQTSGWKQRKQKRHRKNFAQRQSRKSVASSKETEVEEEEEEEEVFEIEITDAMREFLAKASENKRQKEILKAEEENNSTEKETKCVNIEDVADQPRDASHLPPSERPGALRTAQMKQLYGKKAGLIHGMETAVQMEFDRIIDVLQPKLWPNMPFKCHFH